MPNKQRAFQFELKSLDESGVFAGYGSVFGVVDSYNEAVAQGAFTRSLEELKAKGRIPALLWQHRMSEPIGIYRAIREDSYGLYVEGQLALKTPRGAEAYELLKMGALSGLSIGYALRAYEQNNETGIVTLTDVDLWEISLVTFPANDDARIGSVRSALTNGEVPDIRTLETELRDVFGFSQKQAKALLASGYGGISQRDVDDADAIKGLIENITRTMKGA